MLREYRSYYIDRLLGKFRRTLRKHPAAWIPEKAIPGVLCSMDEKEHFNGQAVGPRVSSRQLFAKLYGVVGYIGTALNSICDRYFVFEIDAEKVQEIFFHGACFSGYTVI